MAGVGSQTQNLSLGDGVLDWLAGSDAVAPGELEFSDCSEFPDDKERASRRFLCMGRGKLGTICLYSVLCGMANLVW